MSFVTELIDMVRVSPKKQEKYNRCLQRFDDAYADVIKMLPEQTVDNLIKQIPDKEKKSV